MPTPVDTNVVEDVPGIPPPAIAENELKRDALVSLGI
jgi:hypothetical protein